MTSAKNSVGVLAALALLAGCSPDFAPYNRLTSLRVLAMQSEPAAPAMGETATLSALVFTPEESDPTLTYEWQWCPFPGQSGDGYPCLVTEEQVAMFGQVPTFQLGTAPTAMLQNTVDPAVLAALCEGVPGAPFAPDCANGFPVQIKLIVRTATDRVEAVATSRWRLDGTSPNTNPTVDGLSATLGDPPMPQPVEDQPTVTLLRDVTTDIQAAIPMAASETYDGLDDDGNPAVLEERLFATWFIETGGTDDSRTSFISGRTPFEDLLKNKWTPALEKDYPGATARLFVVIHDNRGGVGWRRGIVTLGPKP